jgi:hypothetical protein
MNSHINIIEIKVDEQNKALAICSKNRQTANICIKNFIFREDNYIHDMLRICSNFIFAKDPCQ